MIRYFRLSIEEVCPTVLKPPTWVSIFKPLIVSFVGKTIQKATSSGWSFKYRFQFPAMIAEPFADKVQAPPATLVKSFIFVPVRCQDQDPVGLRVETNRFVVTKFPDRH